MSDCETPWSSLGIENSPWTDPPCITSDEIYWTFTDGITVWTQTDGTPWELV